MAGEKSFENKIKKFLKDNECWFIKYWAGAAFTKSGIPDILACVNGYFLAIEVKGPKGEPSELQKYNIEKIQKAGGFGIIIRPDQFEDFKELIEYLASDEFGDGDRLEEKINSWW